MNTGETPAANQADAAWALAKACFLEGIGHFEAGHLAAARASFTAALDHAPGRTSVLTNLGLTLCGLEQWPEAVATFQQALAVEAAQPDVWFALGEAHAAQAQWREAAQALERGLALDPLRPDIWMKCGECLANAGRPAEALSCYARVLNLDPQAASAWSARGGLLRDLGQLDEAAHCFEQAIALGADAELHAYYLAAVRGKACAAPPRVYVETLFDQYAVDFEAHLVGQLQYCGHDGLVRPLLDGGPRWGTVLDLGCGTGLCGSLLSPHADIIDGVDLSASMLEQARARGVYRRLIHDDIVYFLAETPDTADLVVAADVFIYVGALDEVFRHVRRILVPGGRFAFTVELDPTGDGFRLMPSLRYAHSEPYIRQLATRFGFSVLDSRRAPLRQNQQAPLDALYVYLTTGPIEPGGATP